MSLAMEVRAEMVPMDGDTERFAREVGNSLQGDLYDVVWSTKDETAYLVRWENREELEDL